MFKYQTSILPSSLPFNPLKSTYLLFGKDFAMKERNFVRNRTML